MSGYNQSRDDLESLEIIAELSDWAPIEEQMIQLMRDPSKKFAAQLYEAAIRLWFSEHGVSLNSTKLYEIAVRHGVIATTQRL